MDCYWDGKPRATVPTAAMMNSPDVLSPNAETAEQSLFPLGLGIYSKPQGGGSPSPLPLFYVSPLAAAARAPGANEQNGPGVRPGWYALARPDEAFDVRISLVNDARAGAHDEEYMSTSLRVDGISNNSYKVFCKSPPHTERVERGYIQRVEKGDSFRYRSHLRPFLFRSASSETPASGDAAGDVGTICLRVYVGKAVPRNPNAHMEARKFEALGSVGVSEKAAAKEGRSLRVGTGSSSFSSGESLSSWTTPSKRRVDDAGVEVFVREHTWMRSRRIIDDAGHACTAARFQILLRQDCLRPLAEADRRQSKRAKTQPKVVKEELQHQGSRGSTRADTTSTEIVDLT